MSKNQIRKKEKRASQLQRLLESFDKSFDDILDCVIYEPQCKICNSVYRREVDEWLLAGMVYVKIIKSMKNLGEKVNKSNVSIHWNKHVEAPLIQEIMKLVNANKLKMIDGYEKLNDTFDLWNNAINSIQSAINDSDMETVHTKIAVLNNLLKTHIKMIEVLGKFQGKETTKKNLTPNAIEALAVEIKDEISKSG